MIAILDYGIGNLFSVQKIFQKIRADVTVITNPQDVERASKLVLPGVGNFASCMNQLEASGLIPSLNDAVIKNKIPLLGICVGMQMLTLSSEEGGRDGLGWVKAITRRFPSDVSGAPLRIPHVGWNKVEGRGNLFVGINDSDSRFYFTHSYYLECAQEADVAGWSDYGIRFAAAIQCGNIYGVQFHPEKSHSAGMALLKNFAEHA